MLEPGGMLIFDTRNIFDIAHIEHSEQLVITIPRNSLAMADGAIYTYGHNFDNERGLSKLLYEMLRQSVDSYGLLTTASRMSIGQSILHLLPNILCPTNAGDDSHLGSAGIIIQGIKSYIEQNLTDPSLTIEKIAEENNCSVRSVHRIFKMTDMGSVSHYIWSRRITSAANVLADPGHLSRSITDIAFSFGFSSSAHFSRTFKSYYGITPREHRNTTYLMNQ